MTKAERELIPKISFELAQQGINPERWELNALARGARVKYGDKEFRFTTEDEWPEFSLNSMK